MMQLRKGATGWNFAMLISVMIIVMLASLRMSIGSVYASTATQSIDDLNRITEAKSTADIYSYDYVPLAFTYSVQQASHTLGMKGGGEEIKWSESSLESSSSTQYGFARMPGVSEEELHPIYNQIYSNLEENTESYYDDNYESSASTTSCAVRSSGFQLSFLQRIESLEGTVYNSRPLQSSCTFASGDVHYRGGENFVSFSFTAADNRYLELVKEQIDAFQDLKDSWDEVSTYSSTKKDCGGDYPVEEAHNSALGKAEDAIKQKFNDALSSYPKTGGFQVTKQELVEMDQTFDTGDDTDVFNGSETIEKSTGDCNCQTDDGNEICDTEYIATSTIDPEFSKARLYINDTRYHIPSEEGWVNLAFRVDPYIHKFD